MKDRMTVNTVCHRTGLIYMMTIMTASGNGIRVKNIMDSIPDSNTRTVMMAEISEKRCPDEYH